MPEDPRDPPRPELSETELKKLDGRLRRLLRMNEQEIIERVELGKRVTNYISPSRPPMAQNTVGGTDQWGDWDRRHRHGRGRCGACWHAGSAAG